MAKDITSTGPKIVRSIPRKRHTAKYLTISGFLGLSLELAKIMSEAHVPSGYGLGVGAILFVILYVSDAAQETAENWEEEKETSFREVLESKYKLTRTTAHVGWHERRLELADQVRALLVERFPQTSGFTIEGLGAADFYSWDEFHISRGRLCALEIIVELDFTDSDATSVTLDAKRYSRAYSAYSAAEKIFLGVLGTWFVIDENLGDIVRSEYAIADPGMPTLILIVAALPLLLVRRSLRKSATAAAEAAFPPRTLIATLRAIDDLVVQTASSASPGAG